MDRISYSISCTVLLTVILTGCVKDISIPQPQYASRAVIECSLEPGAVPVLYFYKTIPYFETATLSQLFIRNAKVQISCKDTTDFLMVDSVYNYVKCEYDQYYKGSVPVKANTQYMLKIRDSNGKIYTATANTGLPKVTIDSVGYISQFKDIYGEHEGVVPYFHDIPNQLNYYRYEMTRIVDSTMTYNGLKLHGSCLGRDSLTVLELGRSVYNDQSAGNGEMKLIVEPAYSHKQGQTGLVRIETIDKAAYDFFDQLDKQKLAQTNPFIEPLFLTNGQFGTDALGYFGCMAKSDPVLFVFPE